MSEIIEKVTHRFYNDAAGFFLDDYVITKWVPHTKKHYESLGYIYTGMYTELKVKPFHLTKGSAIKVNVKCLKCHYARFVHFKSMSLICSTCKNKELMKNLRSDKQLMEKAARNTPKGENSPHWKKDKNPNERANDRRYYKQTIEWRNLVFEAHKFTCKICSQVGGKLNAHHLDGWNWCSEKRFDVDNGVALCESCHLKFHNKYGKGNNTKEQFEEFLNGKF